LHFQRLPVLLKCQDCGKEYQPASEEFACPQCGGTRVQVKAGDEFHLEAIDVEE
jgi:Zn finger protein HypA/HybF involved in hydrogenase expression